jgi:hypothetical protein
VCHPELGYAGTLDRVMATELADVADMLHPGCRLAHVLDVKTGKDVWPDAALQMSGYANATHVWDPEADTITPMAEMVRGGLCPEAGIVAAVHADVAELYPLRLVEAWPGFTAAMAVWQWSNVDSKGAVGNKLPSMANAYPW